MKCLFIPLLLATTALFAVEYPPDLPAHFDPTRKDAVIDAVQVWRKGSAYLSDRIQPIELNIITDEDHKPQIFEGIDAVQARKFLDSDSCKPVVQFSCAIVSSPYEDALETALTNGTAENKLQALAILLHAQAPQSVDPQWKALQELKVLEKGPLWATLLKDMEAEFQSAQLEQTLSKPLPAIRLAGISFTPEEWTRSEYGKRHYYWSIRVAGVTQNRALLPRLAELSVDDDLDTNLAAERSIENFSGPESDAALAKCVTGWRYNASEHAADALLKRNPKLLNDTLIHADIPKESHRMAGIYLARCDNSAAVPLLCETVGKTSIIDSGMFMQIGRLAREEHLLLLKKLPDQVRPEQKSHAEKILKECIARFAK